MSVTPEAVLFLFFGFTPKGVQFIKGAILNGPLGFAQCLFDKTKAPLNLGVGRAQSTFGVDLEVAGQVDGGEQQVADLVGQRLRVLGIYRHCGDLRVGGDFTCVAHYGGDVMATADGLIEDG